MCNFFNISLKPLIDEVITAIFINESKINLIDEIVDSIKLKTDLIPQNVRGHFSKAYLRSISTSFEDVLNFSGHGKLHMLSIRTEEVANTMELILTIDGTSFNTLSFTGDILHHPVIPFLNNTGRSDSYLQVIDETSERNKIFNLEFDTSLRVQIRVSSGVPNQVACSVFYSSDSF